MARSLAQGAGAAAASLTVYFFALRQGYGEFDVRTLTFATLIVTNLALILTSRTLTRSVFGTLRTPNRTLWLLLSGAAGTLALILAVPPVRELFRLAPAHVDDASIIAGAGVLALAWMESVKWAIGAPRVMHGADGGRAAHPSAR